jgi:hypothetical protein
MKTMKVTLPMNASTSGWKSYELACAKTIYRFTDLQIYRFTDLAYAAALAAINH